MKKIEFSKMTESLKSWFCYVADLWFLQLLAGGLVALIWIISKHGSVEFGTIDLVLLGTLSFIIAHAILAAILKDKFITYPLADYIGHGHTFIKADDGNFTSLRFSIWGKTKRYSINRYPYPLWAFENCLKDTPEFEISIDGKHKNIHVKVPGIIFMKLSDQFNDLELFNLLYKNQATGEEKDGHVFSLQKYVVDSFRQANKDSQKVIDNIVKEFFENNLSSVEMLAQIQVLIKLPEKLFSNVASIHIRLDNPTYTSGQP